MDYNKHYNNLIIKAHNRTIKGYTEKHHIIPRCIGGTDDSTNIVELTPEEHYVAHQLLVKIHPNCSKILRAAIMMIPNRPTNKLYGWLKRRFSYAQQQEMLGSKNTQYNTMWISNITEKKNSKIKKDTPILQGWAPGRSLWNRSKDSFLPKAERAKNRAQKISKSLKIAYSTGTRQPQHMSKERRQEMSKRQKGNKSLTGRIWITDGCTNRAILRETPIPQGWYKGKKLCNRGELVSCMSSKHG